jgi:hypothetical protein
MQGLAAETWIGFLSHDEKKMRLTAYIAEK